MCQPSTKDVLLPLSANTLARYVYLDDIIIWSNSVEEHVAHLREILSMLRAACLIVNPKKCCFIQLEVDFLGHYISAQGIEAGSEKVNKVLNWLRPQNAKEVRGLLGLVRYIAPYLPKLADFTRILTLLTMKESQRHFPLWTPEHEAAFVMIKALVVSRECLTMIDHDNPGENKNIRYL
jgi:hypothetical protein